MIFLMDFNLFEARLIDVMAGIKGNDSEILDKFKDYQRQSENDNFDKSAHLILTALLDKKYQGRQIKLKIRYGHTQTHDLIKRIEERTDLKSVKEFNEKITQVIRELIPGHIDKEITPENDKYSVFLEYSKYTLIFTIKYNHIISNNPSLVLNTIIPGKKEYGKLITLKE